MISEDDMEREMLEDLEYLFQHYMSLLKQGKSNIRELNIVIRALKHAHRYFSLDDKDDESV